MLKPCEYPATFNLDQGTPSGQGRQSHQGGAGPAQIEGTQTQERQAAGQELGFTGGGLRVADMVPACDARADAAAPAGAKVRGTSGHQGVPHRCFIDSGGRSRLAPSRAKTTQSGNRVLGIYPQAG